LYFMTFLFGVGNLVNWSFLLFQRLLRTQRSTICWSTIKNNNNNNIYIWSQAWFLTCKLKEKSTKILICYFYRYSSWLTMKNLIPMKKWQSLAGSWVKIVLIERNAILHCYMYWFITGRLNIVKGGRAYSS
jgi:hypothetical protein